MRRALSARDRSSGTDHAPGHVRGTTARVRLPTGAPASRRLRRAPRLRIIAARAVPVGRSAVRSRARRRRGTFARHYEPHRRARCIPTPRPHACLWPPIVDSHVHLAYWPVARRARAPPACSPPSISRAPEAALDARRTDRADRVRGPMLTHARRLSARRVGRGWLRHRLRRRGVRDARSTPRRARRARHQARARRRRPRSRARPGRRSPPRTRTT